MFRNGFTITPKKQRHTPPKRPLLSKPLLNKQKNPVKQQKEQRNQQGDQAAKQQNIQALVNAHQGLLQQEEDLLVKIGRIKNAQENARRKWHTGPWLQNQPQPYQYQTDAAEANLPLLEGRLQNVRDEKERVRKELERAQRESR